MLAAIDVVIPYPGGQLAGTLHVADGPLVIVVHGSGPCDREMERIAARVEDLLGENLSVLVYDKPGCGGSDGDWTQQTFHDRGLETRAAVTFARDHPAVAGRPIALVGQSQGGWVSLIAAAADDRIAAVVTTSGPGVRVAEQEIFRLGHDRDRLGLSAAESDAAVAFLRRRLADIEAGRTVDEIFEREEADREATWRAAIGETSRAELAFEVGIYLYDPADDLRALAMPVLGVFGGADRVIPVKESIGRYLDILSDARNRADPRSRLLVVPDADHGLRRPGSADAPPGLWAEIATWIRAAILIPMRRHDDT